MSARAARLGYWALLALAAGTGEASAQHQAQPYRGLEARPIKALSPEQIADLKGGRGMGLALAAELNGYPGPMHVLELGRELGLTEAQRGEMTALVTAMRSEAIPLGERLIAAEAELDRLFKERVATEAKLKEATEVIGALQAALRAAHLRYHLSTVAALSAHQATRYGDLRGYGGEGDRHMRQH